MIIFDIWEMFMLTNQYIYKEGAVITKTEEKNDCNQQY